METKIFLIDLDGVVVNRADFFSNRAKSLYPDANHEAIMDFFTGGTYKKTALGELDLKETIEGIIADWNVGVSTDELLQTWFGGENNVDEKVLERIQEIRAKGIKCVIATDHSLYRKDDVWEHLNMKDSFDGILASADCGFTKEEPEFFTKAMEMFDVAEASQMAFIDDDPENVEIAKSLGINAITYTDIASFNTW